MRPRGRVPPVPDIAVVRSASSFVDTVDIPADRAALSEGKWKYSCGLEMVDASIKNTPDDHYVTKNPDIMQLAHERHHAGLDTDYVKPSLGESHDATATLYFQSEPNDQGEYVLTDAWCSCGYDA